MATVLPDACGSNSQKFSVTIQKNEHSPQNPASGQAQLVLAENVESDYRCFASGCGVTVRVGIDGSWVGADKGNSWFVVNLLPGEHHLCVNWQSRLAFRERQVDVAKLDAHAGQRYYFEVAVIMKVRDNGHQIDRVRLRPLDLDHAQYLLKISGRSKSTPNR